MALPQRAQLPRGGAAAVCEGFQWKVGGSLGVAGYRRNVGDATCDEGFQDDVASFGCELLARVEVEKAQVGEFVQQEGEVVVMKAEIDERERFTACTTE